MIFLPDITEECYRDDGKAYRGSVQQTAKVDISGNANKQHFQLWSTGTGNFGFILLFAFDISLQ